MPYITVKDGTQIFYKDWGHGQPVMFHHGWPLSADDWDAQMLFFLQHGYRVIAHDRRGHGRSGQPHDGHDMDTYASDVDELATALGLKNAIHIGHSTGGGEVVRYIARHGQSRVAKAVLVSAVPPIMLKSETNLAGQDSAQAISAFGWDFHGGPSVARLVAARSSRIPPILGIQNGFSQRFTPTQPNFAAI